MSTKRHDLIDFMRQMQLEMAGEYERIRKHSAENPEVAGDQGEENWKQLLTDWLPPGYQIVTRGQLLDDQGRTSPQVDVLVLKPTYPCKLLGKKRYLAAGVAAAFECKLTLAAAHIREAVETAVAVKSMFPARTGTPYRELHAPIIFGLLTHSHSWKGRRSKPLDTIDGHLRANDEELVAHPRLGLDLLCVADLAMWDLRLGTMIGPALLQERWQGISDSMIAAGLPEDFREGYAVTCYHRHAERTNAATDFTPVGLLLSSLLRRLAWECPENRDLAFYFARTIHWSGGGIGRQWSPEKIYVIIPLTYVGRFPICLVGAGQTADCGGFVGLIVEIWQVRKEEARGLSHAGRALDHQHSRCRGSSRSSRSCGFWLWPFSLEQWGAAGAAVYMAYKWGEAVGTSREQLLQDERDVREGRPQANLLRGLTGRDLHRR